MKNQKQGVKLADGIIAELRVLQKARLKETQLKLQDIVRRSTEAVKEEHRFTVAVERNWFCAAGHVIQRISRNLDDFSYYLARFKEFVNRDQACLPTLSDMVSELLQIEQEFEQVNFDFTERTLSVTTPRIVLEEVHFGPFKIKLYIDDLKKLYTDRPYRIIALEPNPAASDSNVTHPHVSCEKLCEGDGHTAISKALEQGRLCDFFMMVIGVLEHYNPDSPYIALSDWEGSSCYDCGSTICSDESYYCESCGNDYCDHCSTYCQKCDTTLCLSCMFECPDCENQVCKRCTASCKACHTQVCKDCLTDGLCQECQDQRKEEDHEENTETLPAV